MRMILNPFCISIQFFISNSQRHADGVGNTATDSMENFWCLLLKMNVLAAIRKDVQ